MDYREYAKDLLARKNSLISAYGAIREELRVLENEKTACKELMNECEVLGRDKSSYEDRFINTLANLDDCRFRLSVVERELKKIEKGMSQLDEYECAKINDALRKIKKGDMLRVIYYKNDRYDTAVGICQRIDLTFGNLTVLNHHIPTEDIIYIEIE